MKKPVLKVTAWALSAALLCTGVGFAAYAQNSNKGALDTAVTDNADTNTPSEESTVSSADLNEALSKDETVYVITDADGSVEQLIVSDWVKNPQSLSEICDRSELENIENVKTDAEYTLSSDGAQVWSANGEDLYYQGTIQKELPVDMSVSYKLDGQSIEGKDLAGKSGKVTIRFDYTNNQYEYVDVDGNQEKIYVPFAMITGLVLDTDRFSNVSVSNGKVLSDGNQIVVVGLALPGLQDDLNVDKDTLDIPDYVEVTADVTDFELSMTMTVATNSVFANLNLDDVSTLDELDSSMGELTDAMDKLIDGAGELYDGLNELASGADEISSGVGQLYSGLNTLDANSSALNSGAGQVFDSLLSIANQQIAAAGLDVPTLTRSNYATVLNGVLSNLDENAVIATARSKVESAVRANESTVKEAVTAAVEQQVSQQVTAAVRQQVQQQVLASLGLTEVVEEMQAQIDAGVEQQMQTDDVKALISSNLESQMQSEQVQATINEKTEEQIQALIAQNMASDDVQAQITAGLEQAGAGAQQLQSLKAQLDSYSSFYNGLLSYTNGVSQAAQGAEKLNKAMPSFVSGVDQLKSGASQLQEGLKQFNEEGISKLTGAFTNNFQGIIERLRATVDAAKNYQTFAGMGDNMNGEVKFIYKTGTISSSDK